MNTITNISYVLLKKTNNNIKNGYFMEELRNISHSE